MNYPVIDRICYSIKIKNSNAYLMSGNSNHNIKFGNVPQDMLSYHILPWNDFNSAKIYIKNAIAEDPNNYLLFKNCQIVKISIGIIENEYYDAIDDNDKENYIVTNLENEI